ncbi:MAG: transcription termination/antitermination NusG family protein [Verrucomicrobiota bacterium]|nr:transcription termination/antitermination NusG family protein [Verrucomicrobiota bacterium]
MLNLKQEVAWYCICTRPKREAVAAQSIGKVIGVEVFAPRVIYKKRTSRGVVRFNEALFPGYLFVRCDLSNQYRYLLSLNGVRGVVHYGGVVPCIPDVIMQSLLLAVGKDAVHEIPEAPFMPGSEVVVVGGPFTDITAVVKHVIPAKGRVRILLEFLGRQMELDVEAYSLYSPTVSPKAVLHNSLQ